MPDMKPVIRTNPPKKTQKEIEIENLEVIVNDALAKDEDIIRLNKVIEDLTEIMNRKVLHEEIAIGKRDRIRRLCSALFNSYLDVKLKIAETIILTKQEIQHELIQAGKI